MRYNTQLLEPIKDATTELVLRREWEEDPRAQGIPISLNQLSWRQRSDDEFRESCMTKFGRDWMIHIPSLIAYLSGTRRSNGDPRAA